MDGAAAVSYTHLDVYKRQAPGRPWVPPSLFSLPYYTPIGGDIPRKIILFNKWREDAGMRPLPICYFAL